MDGDQRVRVRTEPAAGAMIYYRGEGRPTFRWKPAPTTSPTSFKVSYSAVSGKSVLGLMTLEAPVGTVLKITVDGEDADLAMAEIEELVRNHFGIADE